MPTAVENYIFNELPRRVVIDSSIATGSSFTASWVLVATGVGTQTIPTDPTALGFEPAVTPPGVDPAIKFWNGNKDWVEISAAAIGAIPTSEKGQPLGVATLDADGYVELSQMNPAVIERVVVVADEAARYALTTAQVQNGDVVNQQSPLPETMWYVVDDTNLDNSAGYLPFSAGVAASVAWSGITGKPAIVGDLENIALAAEGDVIQYVGGEWVNVDPATLKTSLSISISDVASLQDELDLKQSQSTVLDNLSAISTPGIVVRTVDGYFIGRELVGINGLEVAEADGNGDNPTISLTETGVVAGTYGNEYEHPVVEVDSYGRVIAVTEASSSNKEVVYILDQPTTALAGNTRHIFGGAVSTYTNNLLLELPENVPGGTWVKILCAQNFSEASGTIGISATNPTTVQGTSLFDYTAFFKLYPFTVIDLVYSSSTNNWTLTTNATSFLSSLYVIKQGATDGVSNSHAIISNATSPRSLNIPDRDVDLSSVGQTDFSDTAFRVSDNTDSTKKIAFQASAISTGQTKTITMPDADVDLGNCLTSAEYTPNTGLITLNNINGDATTLDMGRVYRYANLVSGAAPSQPNVNTLFNVYANASISIVPLVGGHTWEFFSTGDVSVGLSKNNATPIVDTEGNLLLGSASGSISIQLARYCSVRVTGYGNCWVVDYGASRTYAPSGQLGLVSTSGEGAGSTKYKTTFVRSDGTSFISDTTVTLPVKNVDLGTMSSIATADSNTLSGTRTRIVGGSNNNVSGTDNVAIGCTSVTLSGTGNSAYNSTGVTLAGNTSGTAQFAIGVRMASGVTLSAVDWAGAVITGSNAHAGALGYEVLSGWPTDLISSYIPFGVLVETSGIRGIRAPEIGLQYVWADGRSYTGTRADVGGSNPKAVLSAGKSAVHEVTFIYIIGNYNMYTAVRRVAVGGGLGTIATARVSSVQTVGTDIALEEYAAFEDPIFTITVDLTNNLVIPTVEKNNGGQPVIVQTRTRSYYT